ncbi:MAG: sigma-70 family RNA polymerase sigma factor [Ruminococcus sp.]|nr:sigma-70 family RNA polymerase sigma factor [Ruminococcus sp.]
MNDFPKDVRLAQKGDSQAFARLYALVYEDMYHIALYSLRNSHDACDAVSDAVLDAFTSIENLKDEKAFKNWIMRILSAKIKQRQTEYYRDTEELTEINEPAEDFSYENAELNQALESLDPQSRLILSMSVLEGYTSEEISEVCSLNASSVRSRLKRIKERLKLELAGKI